MAKDTIQTSETFWSFQGEVQVGKPQVWIRTTLCNFECRGFGNPTKEDTTSIQVLKFDPRQYDNLVDMPNVNVGCDSQYSWNKGLFEHTWTTWTLSDLADHLVDLIPFKAFVHPATIQPVGLTITGGEPGLKLRELAELLHEPVLKDLRVVTIETNCSVPIRWEQIERLNQWLMGDPCRKLVWSNSPKLSNSGEKWKMAIRPKVAAMQRMVTGKEFCNQMEQYFKFVSDGSDQSFEEISQAMNEYYTEAIIPRDVPIWIMPEGATTEQQNDVQSMICDRAMARGYNVAPRVHVHVYGNRVNT